MKPEPRPNAQTKKKASYDGQSSGSDRQNTSNMGNVRDVAGFDHLHHSRKDGPNQSKTKSKSRKINRKPFDSGPAGVQKIYNNESLELIRDSVRWCEKMPAKAKTNAVLFKAEAKAFKEGRSGQTAEKYHVHSHDLTRITLLKDRKGDQAGIMTIFCPSDFNGQQGNLLKLFDYVMSLNIQYDSMGNPFVRYPYSDLTDAVQMFKSETTARNNSDLLFQKLKRIEYKIQGSGQSEDGYLFYRQTRRKGIHTIYLNPYINWQSFRTDVRMYVPCYFYSLPALENDLCRYVFYRANMSKNRARLRDGRKFRMKVRTIADKLCLPVEGSRLFELTIDPIFKALHNIELIHGEYYGAYSLYFTDDEGNPISPYEKDDLDDNPRSGRRSCFKNMSAKNILDEYITVHMDQGLFLDLILMRDKQADQVIRKAIKEHSK